MNSDEKSVALKEQSYYASDAYKNILMIRKILLMI